jgi:hypothetical protein
MVSRRRAKGYRSVSKVRKALEQQGYMVANLEKNSKFCKERDLWNLWDLLALKDKEHIFIQVKTNMSGLKWKNKYIEFGRVHSSELVKYQIWNVRDYGTVLVTECV